MRCVVPSKRPARTVALIHRAMELASGDLLRMRYFDAERRCRRALARARTLRDYEMMARILLPLQEARRQKRQLAVDAGRAAALTSLTPDPLAAGAACLLLRPSLTARDARALRERADARKIPTLVLAAEGPDRDGAWSVVAEGRVKVRARVELPGDPLARSPAGVATVSQISWFEAAAEALGDAAIAQVPPDASAAAQVDALLGFLDAFPDHEKLHQRLAEACRRAAADM